MSSSVQREGSVFALIWSTDAPTALAMGTKSASIARNDDGHVEVKVEKVARLMKGPIFWGRAARAPQLSDNSIGAISQRAHELSHPMSKVIFNVFHCVSHYDNY